MRAIIKLLGAALLSVVSGLASLVPGSPARADVPPGSMAVVVTMSTDDDPGEAEGLADAVRDAAQARGAAVIGDGSDRVEAKHSAPAVRPGDDRLTSLRDELDAVTRHLALGELQRAIKRMKTMETLHHDALDFLSREAAQARKLFEACVMTGYLLHQNGRVTEGKEQMRMCAASFPGYEPRKDAFTDAVRTLYQEVTSRGDATDALLVVEGVDAGGGCGVRLNGIRVGSSPMEVRTRPSAVRVQLECGNGLGRIHTVKLKRGRQKVRIDPNLDAALDTSASMPMLRHLSRLPEDKVTRQLVELGKAMGVDHVLEVNRTDEGWALGLIDVRAGAATARAKVHKDHSGAAVGRLFAAPRSGGDDVEGELFSGDASGERRSLIGTGRVDGAYFALVGTVWLLSPIGTALVLADRADVRVETQAILAMETSDFEAQDRVNQLGDQYNTDVFLGFAASGAPSLWLAISSMFLPDTDGIPWYAWVGGAVGATLIGAGIAVNVGSDTCGLEDAGSHCKQWTADPLMGPFLAVHGAGPLSVLLSYLIAEAVDDGKASAGAYVQVDDDSAALVVHGIF